MKIFDLLWNRIMIKRKAVMVGENFTSEGKLYFHGKKGGIKIGNDCSIYSNESINPTSGFVHTHLVVGENGLLTIGNNVGMSHVNITAYNRVTIEDNVLLGSGVKIWDTDFHPINYEDRKNNNQNYGSAPVIISEGAFIGACSIILKGVTIGRHSVVGAGSVVTKSIPDGEIWAGNPVRFIKKLEDF